MAREMQVMIIEGVKAITEDTGEVTHDKLLARRAICSTET